MKVGILVNGEIAGFCPSFAARACQIAKVEGVVLDWTEDYEKDLAQLEAQGIAFLIVDGYPTTQYGFRFAQIALERLGVEPVVVSHAPYSFPDTCPIERVTTIDRLVQCISEGSTLMTRDPGFKETVAALERAIRIAYHAEATFLNNLARVQGRRKAG